MAEDDGAPDSGKPKEPKDQKRREQILVAAAVGGVILTVLLIKRTSSNNAATAAQQATPAYLPGSAGSPGSYSGGVASSDFYSLEAQVQGLSQQLSDLRGATGSSSPTPISTNPSAANAPQGAFGAGFGPLTAADWKAGVTENPVFSNTGTAYEWLPSGTAVQASMSSGTPIFYEAAPGVFSPAESLAKSPAGAGTPIFLQSGQ